MTIVVLAAGKGVRMNDPKVPKVMQKIAGHPLLEYVLSTSEKLLPTQAIVVMGSDSVHQEQIHQLLKTRKFPWKTAVQDPPLGTGHAVQVALKALGEIKGKVLVLMGDAPLISLKSLKMLSDNAKDASFLAMDLVDGGAYGRVLGERQGSTILVHGIKEAKDCTKSELEIRSVNGGIYGFEADYLAKRIAGLTNKNSQGEYYLTDVVEKGAEAFIVSPDELCAANNIAELMELQKTYFLMKARELQKAGVRIWDETQVWIGPDVIVEPGAVIENMVKIFGKSFVGSGAYIRQGVILENSHIESGAEVLPYCVLNGCVVKSGAHVGPFVHSRGETTIGENAKVGNFVETKKTHVGKGSKISHLSYAGDTNIGEGVNIGCMFVNVNYDGGPVKHTTTIEDGAFIGCAVQSVAPVTVGKDSYVAAGTTLTHSVPAEALAIARTKQVNKPGYATIIRKKKKKLSKEGT